MVGVVPSIVVASLSKTACLVCALTVVLAAQDIKTNVHLVLVPTTVMDKHGTLIDGLSADDFAVFDDNVRQQVHMDTSDTVLAPVSLVVLVQSSGISTPALARIRLVGAMIKPLVI